MSHSPMAQFLQGTGSGWRTIPATRSPRASSPPPGASITRPRDSWPSTRRSRPGGAQPYLPPVISRSVPQTPSASACTSTAPAAGSGSGRSSSRALPCLPGTTVIARIAPLCQAATRPAHERPNARARESILRPGRGRTKRRPPGPHCVWRFSVPAASAACWRRCWPATVSRSPASRRQRPRARRKLVNMWTRRRLHLALLALPLAALAACSSSGGGGGGATTAATTGQLALVVDDTDAPGGTFVHWVMSGIPASQTQLAENAVPSGAREARDYTGPCPPSGPAHHYRVTVYALGRSPGIERGADPQQAIAAIQAAATAQGQLVGTFQT